MKASLAEIAPQFSDHFVHFPNDTRNYVPTNFGPEITLTKSNIETGYSQELGRGHVAVCSTTALQVGFQMPAPSARPPCLLSVQNELEWEIQGIVVSADTPEHLLTPDYPGAQHFLGYSRVRLPVGWERIDVYPALADEYWKPEYASAWAELDILAEIVRRNSLELMLHGIDGRLATRQHYANLLREFQSLLQGPEEPAHQFLKKHPGLLCPTHDRMWSKLPFGDNVSDFVFREPHNDYLLVEIESPIRELFRKDGQQRAELTHAINQITDWVQYISDNKQQLEEDLGLTGISTNPRKLVVIGRSMGLTEENRRKLVALQDLHSSLTA